MMETTMTLLHVDEETRIVSFGSAVGALVIELDEWEQMGKPEYLAVAAAEGEELPEGYSNHGDPNDYRH